MKRDIAAASGKIEEANTGASAKIEKGAFRGALVIGKCLATFSG